MMAASAVALTTDLTPFTLEHFRWWVEENELTLEDGDDWRVEGFQERILDDIFAGFREVWAIIPEGNAKSTFFGGVALYHADHTRSPWVPIGAASRDQAEILFGQAGGFVYRSPKLQERFRVYEGYRKITNKVTGGRGIKVCAGLLSFRQFYSVAGPRPEGRLTIDRIDNSGHYSCGSCQECVVNGWTMNLRWITHKENCQNTRRNVLLTFRFGLGGGSMWTGCQNHSCA